ncbi:methyltransferase domain-containing protein [Plantactinospora veratri]
MTGGGPAAAREANRRCYGDGRSTRAYLDDPYHAVRRQLIGEALIDAVHRLDAAGAADAHGGPAGAPGAGILLELGSGAQSVFDGLPELRRPTVVADLSWSALAELKDGRHHPIQLDVTRPLPLADRSAAGVVAAELIEHLYHPGHLLAEIARVLRPGGALVLSTPNLATLQDRIRFLFGRSPARSIRCIATCTCTSARSPRSCWAGCCGPPASSTWRSGRTTSASASGGTAGSSRGCWPGSSRASAARWSPPPGVRRRTKADRPRQEPAPATGCRSPSAQQTSTSIRNDVHLTAGGRADLAV